MELSDSKIKKTFIFSKKKAFLIFRATEPPPPPPILPQKIPYTLGKEYSEP